MHHTTSICLSADATLLTIFYAMEDQEDVMSDHVYIAHISGHRISKRSCSRFQLWPEIHQKQPAGKHLESWRSLMRHDCCNASCDKRPKRDSPESIAPTHTELQCADMLSKIQNADMTSRVLRG